ncbi:MAG: phosphatase PAP2 family protein [Candidatus Sulfopaludibacter sp.]|nr:phosphatase PAP2 family protein [Candidatus Sulfopaludibacter sp.]
MAELLKRNTGPDNLSTSFWAVDKVIFAYLTFTGLLILGWWHEVPGAAVLFSLHVVAVTLMVYEVKRPNPTSWVFRNWYPLLFVASCYKEMAILIPPVRRTDSDQWLANLDFRIWHANPTVWLERIYSPGLTEYLQVVYTLFVPAVLFVAYLLWKSGKYPEFQYYAFLIALGFLVSYVGYLIVPARGPRFLLKSLEHVPLQGLWGFSGMQHTLDRLESAHYDCFPSGHTELTMLAWWGSRMISKRLFKVYFAYTPSIIFATVYLRYHYTVDVMAGAFAAVFLILASPLFYRFLRERV